AGGYVICLWNTDKGYRKFNLPKPQACFPIYPVTSYRVIRDTKWDIGETKDAYARSSVGCSLEGACNSSFEVPLHVEGFPPTAIFVAAEDELVHTDHSKTLATALEEAGIKVRFEMGETGGHGFADGDGMSMEGWPERAIDFYESL
ncbi:MAG: alpha/beta hydrolase fold domain-containing protein, partial [Lachnospiraceae bacterium]|nr:alpha/beta hydrolase fold domain-containing protein [Lachnospiraceae bacterium]